MIIEYWLLRSYEVTYDDICLIYDVAKHCYTKKSWTYLTNLDEFCKLLLYVCERERHEKSNYFDGRSIIEVYFDYMKKLLLTNIFEGLSQYPLVR